MRRKPLWPPHPPSLAHLYFLHPIKRLDLWTNQELRWCTMVPPCALLFQAHCVTSNHLSVQSASAAIRRRRSCDQPPPTALNNAAARCLSERRAALQRQEGQRSRGPIVNRITFTVNVSTLVCKGADVTWRTRAPPLAALGHVRD